MEERGASRAGLSIETQLIRDRQTGQRCDELDSNDIGLVHQVILVDGSERRFHIRGSVVSHSEYLSYGESAWTINASFADQEATRIRRRELSRPIAHNIGAVAHPSPHDLEITTFILSNSNQQFGTRGPRANLAVMCKYDAK